MTPLPDPARTQRRIIHVDMDVFYASVEQRDDPSLRALPLAVGGSHERGVVAAASYEARRFGVHSAMSSVTARRRCPRLVFVRPRFDASKAVSRQVNAIFARYTPMIQPLSLHEAYLDVTAPLLDRGSATAIAAELRAAIKADNLSSPPRCNSPMTTMLDRPSSFLSILMSAAWASSTDSARGMSATRVVRSMQSSKVVAV